MFLSLIISFIKWSCFTMFFSMLLLFYWFYFLHISLAYSFCRVFIFTVSLWYLHFIITYLYRFARVHFAVKFIQVCLSSFTFHWCSSITATLLLQVSFFLPLVSASRVHTREGDVDSKHTISLPSSIHSYVLFVSLPLFFFIFPFYITSV